jgi:hypothetical protein
LDADHPSTGVNIPRRITDLRDSLRTVSSAQAAIASAIGFDRFWRSRRRWLGAVPLIVSSTS